MSGDKETRASEGPTSGKSNKSSAAQLDRLHRWLTLAANIGVLAGLVLVIAQMNQNTKLARAAYMSEGNVVANQVWATVMGDKVADVIAKSVTAPTEMTHSDFIVMDAYLFPSLNLIYRDYQLAQEGFYTTSDWQASVDHYVHWYLANPFGKAWWDEEAKEFFASEFAAYVDQQLEVGDNRDHYAYWEAIRSRLRESEVGKEQ